MQRLPAAVKPDPMTPGGRTGGRSNRMIDLRSDTYTLPTQAMLERLGSAVESVRERRRGRVHPRVGAGSVGTDFQRCCGVPSHLQRRKSPGGDGADQNRPRTLLSMPTATFGGWRQTAPR